MTRLVLLTSILAILSTPSTPAKADFIRIEENHPSVTYTGSWTAREGASLSGGRLVIGTLGSTATVTFNGTGIHWIEYFHEDVRGGANLYIDGVLVGATRPRDCCVIDVYGEKQLRYSISGLTDATHTLRIVGTGVPFNFSPLITLDAFYIERGGVTRLIQESDPSITYTGEWVEFDDPSVSGGSVLASSDPGATATVRYEGDALSWISYLCPCASGITNVSPFNGIQSTWNAYSPERVPQAMILNRVGGQPGVQNEVTFTVTGETAGGGPWVVIDAFRIQTGSNDGPDTTPPEITIRAPHDGATVSGRVILFSDFFDNEGVSSVRYFVDGAPAVIDTTQRVTKLTHDTWWTTAGEGGPGPPGLITPLPNGPHVLTAVARDAAGNETVSAPVNVIVNNVDPIVLLLIPGSPLTGVVTIGAETSGEFNTALGVRFWARGSDDTLYHLGTDTTAPYSITRDTSTIPSGRSFSVWVEIFDNAGRSFTDGKLVHIQH